MKKRIFIVIVLVFVQFIFAQNTQGDGLTGHYYQGYSLVEGIIRFNTLNEAFTRVDTLIDFWNGSSGYVWQPVPGYGSNYSVQWIGFIYIEEPGQYGFGTISDDGSQIFIDDSLIVDNGEAQWYDWEDNMGEGNTSGEPFEPFILERGFHKFTLSFYENASYDGIELWWIKPSEIDSSDIPWYGANFHSTYPYFNPNTNWELIPKRVLFTSHNFEPVAVTDSILVAEDSMWTFNPLENDFDPDSNRVILTGYDAPAHGSVEAGDSMLTYIPDDNYFGPDSFHYFITDSLNAPDTGLVVIQVTGINDAPGSFSLVAPPGGTTLDSLSEAITFIWHTSADPDGDPLDYVLNIFNEVQDTLITVSEDSFLVFSGSRFFKPESEYNWTVRVSDGYITVDADTFQFNTPEATGIRPAEIQPLMYALMQNYPNPFNPVTRIDYSLAEKGRVVLKVFDIVGKEVATLVDGIQNAGAYSLSFKATNLPSGIYFYSLTSGSIKLTRKMVVIK